MIANSEMINTCRLHKLYKSVFHNVIQLLNLIKSPEYFNNGIYFFYVYINILNDIMITLLLNVEPTICMRYITFHQIISMFYVSYYLATRYGRVIRFIVTYLLSIHCTKHYRNIVNRYNRSTGQIVYDTSAFCYFTTNIQINI